MKAVSLLFVALLLAGCASNDLRKPELLRSVESISMKLVDVEKAIQDYSYKCRPIQKISRSSSNNKEASVMIDAAVQSDVAAIYFIEKGDSTTVMIYSQSPSAPKGEARKYVSAILNPANCQK